MFLGDCHGLDRAISTTRNISERVWLNISTQKMQMMPRLFEAVYSNSLFPRVYSSIAAPIASCETEFGLSFICETEHLKL